MDSVPRSPEVAPVESPGSRGLVATLYWLGRPRLALWVAAIPLFGYAFGHWDGQLVAARGWDLLVLIAAWALLSIGTMWQNAALDQAERSAIFARSVPVPPLVGRIGLGALGLSVALCLASDLIAGTAAAVAAVSSVLYSSPRTAFKGHPVLGPLVNALGYGVLSPLAGWTLSGAAVTGRALLTLALWTCWMLGAYFAAQVFQAEEDRRRGYRTRVVTRGPMQTLKTARACMNAAIAGFLLLAMAGIYPRLTLLSAPVFAWADAHTRAWIASGVAGHAGSAERLYRRMLLGGLALTALTYVDYWFF